MEKKVYEQGIEEVCSRYRTSHLGLSEEEAIKRLEQYGPNQLLEEKKNLSSWYLFRNLRTF